MKLNSICCQSLKMQPKRRVTEELEVQLIQMGCGLSGILRHSEAL